MVRIARRRVTAVELKFGLMIIRASFRLSSKNKKLFIHIRDEEFSFDCAQDRSPRYHPAYVQKTNVTLIAITGFPVDDYFVHHPSLSFEITGEFSLVRSRWALCRASTSLSQLADGMTYYSCPDF